MGARQWVCQRLCTPLIRCVPAYRLEAQVAAGLVLVVLPALVKGHLYFSLCCLTPVWFLISKIFVMRDTTVGSHIRQAVQLSCSYAMGLVWAGAVVSFVKAITVQGSDTELALMCVFGALGALPLAVGRPAAADAVWIWAVSVCIIYGTAVISAHGVASPGAVWEQVIQWLLLSIALACAALVVVGCVVLPVTAAEEVAQGTAKVLVGTAKALDRCMALLCMPTFIASQNQTLTLPWGQHDAAHQQQQPGTELAPASASSPEQPGTARGLSNGCANMGVPCSKIEAGIGSTGQAGGIGDDRPELEPAPSMQPLTLPGAGDLARMTRFEAMLYKATEPPPPPSDLALFKLAPHAAGDHLMPEGQALHLRRARDAVLRLLTVAASEAPLVHTLAAGWAQLRHRLTGGAPHTHSHTPWWQTQFSVPAWQQVLTRLAGVLDSLAALEAVARDLNGLAPSRKGLGTVSDTAAMISANDNPVVTLPPPAGSASSTIPYASDAAPSPGLSGTDAHSGRVQRWGGGGKLGSMQQQGPEVQPGSMQAGAGTYPRAAAQLWLLPDGPELPSSELHAPMSHALHDSVRAALRDCAAQAQVLGGLAQAWPGPHADKAGADQSTGTGTPAELHTLSRDGPDYKPSKAGTPARPHRLSEDGLTRVGSITQQRLRAAVQRLRRSFESGAGPVRRDPFRFEMEGAPDRLTYEQRHSMTWHNRVLASAVLLRARAYWSTTLRSLWQGAEAHQPLQLLPGDRIRAQYFVALTTHQAVCQMQALISDLHTAHHPATAPDLPRTDPLGWAKQLLPLALATDAWRYLGQSVRAGWQAVRGGREAMQRVFGTDLVVAVVKYWAVLTVMLVVILVLLTKLPRNAFSTPPIFAYLTAAAVMRPKVETTTSQAVLRVLSTFLGCLLGWALLSSPHTATDPVLVGAVVIITVTLLSTLTTTQFRLLAFVTCTSVSSTTLCQVAAAGCCAADFKGSTRYAIERFVNVNVGVLLPVVFNHLVFPWYLSHWALGRLADSYKAGTTLLAQQCKTLSDLLTHPHHHHSSPHSLTHTGSLGFSDNPATSSQHHNLDARVPESASGRAPSAQEGSAGGVGEMAPPETVSQPAGSAPDVRVTVQPEPHRQQVTAELADARVSGPSNGGRASVPANGGRASVPANGGPDPANVGQNTKPVVTLAAVNAPMTEVIRVLARDATLWQRGLLATPHAVHALMAAMTLMADRLAAVQVVLQGASAFSPVFSSWSATHLTTPLDPEVRKVLVAIGELSS